MVIDNETLEPLHSLSKDGEKVYKEFLQNKADELILKNDHPFLYLAYKINWILGMNSDLIERKYTQVLNEIKENRL